MLYLCAAPLLSEEQEIDIFFAICNIRCSRWYTWQSRQFSRAVTAVAFSIFCSCALQSEDHGFAPGLGKP